MKVGIVSSPNKLAQPVVETLVKPSAFGELLSHFEKLNSSVAASNSLSSLDSSVASSELKSLFRFQRQTQRLHFMTELTSRSGENLSSTLRRLQQMG